jgi:restriction endonuclease Mrr
MPLPSHTQLMLPLLQTLKDKGGAARPKDLYDEIADQFNLSDEDRNGTVNVGTSVKSTRSSDECAGHGRQQYFAVLSRKTSHLCGA